MASLPSVGCTAADLVTGCFGTQTFNKQQQLAIIVYALVLELEAIGGTDYRSNLTGATAAGGLVYDAAQVFQTMSDAQRMEALVALMMNAAQQAGASEPTDVNAALEDVQCLVCAKEDQLIQMILWLICQLGPHAQKIR